MRDHFANTTLGAAGGMDHTKASCPYPEDVIFELMQGVFVSFPLHFLAVPTIQCSVKHTPQTHHALLSAPDPLST